MLLPGTVQQIVDELLLLSVKGDNTYRFPGRDKRLVCETFYRLCNNGFGLSLIMAPFPFGIDTFNFAPLDGTLLVSEAGKVIKLLS